MLIVEDGTGLANAESYASVAEFRTYSLARGYPVEGKAEPEIEQALRRGTGYIDTNFGARFPGYRINGRGQALAWPRSYVIDSYGAFVASDVVPAEVITATHEASLRELTTPGSLMPDQTPSAAAVGIKRETVGPITVEYFGGAESSSSASTSPVFPQIEAILYPVLTSGALGHYLLRA